MNATAAAWQAAIDSALSGEWWESVSVYSDGRELHPDQWPEELTAAEIAATIGNRPVPADPDEADCVVIGTIEEMLQQRQDRIDSEAADAEYEQAEQVRQRLEALVDLVAESLPNAVRSHISFFGTTYFRCFGLAIRVGDHQQPAGGGFNEATGERYGQADVDIVLGSQEWTREAVRAAVAAGLRKIN